MVGRHIPTAVSIVRHRHEIRKRDHARAGLEAAFNDVRIWQISTAGMEFAARSNFPTAAAVPIEQAGENRGAVESWPA